MVDKVISEIIWSLAFLQINNLQKQGKKILKKDYQINK